MHAAPPLRLRLPPSAAGRRALRLRIPPGRPRAPARPRRPAFRRGPSAAWLWSLLTHGWCVGAVLTAPLAHKATALPDDRAHAVTYLGFRASPPPEPAPAETPPPAAESTPMPETAPPAPPAPEAPPEKVPPEAEVPPPPPAPRTLSPPKTEHAPAPAAPVLPPPPPAAAAGPAGDAGQADALARLQAAIHRHLRYPEIARRHGEEGRIEIVMRIDAGGRLADLRIEPAEAAPRFARAAAQAVRRAQPLPAVPEGEYRIPVRFLLRDAG